MQHAYPCFAPPQLEAQVRELSQQVERLRGEAEAAQRDRKAAQGKAAQVARDAREASESVGVSCC